MPGSCSDPMTRRPSIKRLEHRLEHAMWRVRLIALLPVVMSLLSSMATFILGTLEVTRALIKLGSYGMKGKGFIAVLSDVVTGIDLYLIGIALLIFGYGIYELLISPIEAAREEDTGGTGLLDIRNLDQLKEKLVKVLVVALIVTAFKAMLTIPITDGVSLAFFCLSVFLLALSGYVVTGDGLKLPKKG
ncbi:MAG: YqhA family protein [Cyanobacteriota bacterium]|jgi:uncharacterized membrane protein YqhA|nr:YqhA family protein [Cyanobacteriota bacterium]